MSVGLFYLNQWHFLHDFKLHLNAFIYDKKIRPFNNTCSH